MAAQVVTTSRPQSLRLTPALTALVHALLLATVVMGLFVAGWLLLRRIGGRLQQPLGLPTLLLVGVVLATLASGVRLLWYQTGLRPRQWQSRTALLWFSPCCAVVLLALALSIPGTGSVALILFWSILLLTESVWCRIAWCLVRSPDAATATQASAPADTGFTPQGETVEGEPPFATGAEQHGEFDEESDEQLPDDVCQQLTRARAEEDNDTVAGLLRARFEPGERSHSLHVAFCPPMLRRPRVTVVQLRGPRTRIKAADVQPFGIRFDLRLVSASEQWQDVLIHFEASCSETEAIGLGGLAP